MSDQSGVQLYGDRWDGVLNYEWFVDAKSFDEVNAALLRLDANTYTMVMLKRAGHQHLAVGGGSGRYIVYATSDNEEFWNLVCPEAGNELVMLNAGGQEGDYPARLVVDLTQAQAAMRHYLLHGERDPKQEWEKK